MKEFICIKEASNVSSFSPYFVKKIIKDHKIKYRKIGRKTLIPRKEFMAVLKYYEV